MKSAIVLVVDRLGASFLGPYGNTWIETPNFNRLASESTLFENMIVESPKIEETYQSYFLAKHLLFRQAESPPALVDPSLPTKIASAEAESWLVTDEPRLSATDWEERFTHAHHLPPADSYESADSLEQTQLARFFASAIDIFRSEVQTRDSPFLFWCHCQGMAGAWDAPLAYREQFVDESDPDPPNLVQPPSHTRDDFSPDDLFGFSCSYAGQITALDECLGAFWEAISDRLDDDTIFVVTSPRGYPLGEHGIVGGDPTIGSDTCEVVKLYSELLHVPCMIYRKGSQNASMRVPSLVQPCDLGTTLREWLALESESKSRSLFDIASRVMVEPSIAVASHDSQLAIRTGAWLARIPHIDDQNGGAAKELFLKPDDRWDANDIADRCGELSQEFGQFAVSLMERSANATASESCEWPSTPASLSARLE